MPASDVAQLRDAVTDGYFESENDLVDCNKRNLEWGYIEVQKGQSYNLVYTCGGDEDAGKLFEELMEKTGEQ